MDAKTIVGYHTTARENATKILENGFIPSPPMKNHWLGKGVYFYSDFYYAVEWGIVGVMKREKKTFKEFEKNCAILSSNIDCENFEVLDVSSPLGYTIFLQLLDLIKNNYSDEEYRKIKEDNNAETIRIIEKLEKKQGIKYLSNYDVVCAIYPKNIFKKKIKSNSDFLVGVQKQTCVKNTKAIKDIQDIPINNECTEKIYELVKLNRRNKDD